MNLQLQITTAGSDPFPWEFNGKEFRAGRDQACELSFRNDAAGVSGRHAEFAWRENSLIVRDLGSSNGTYVNGKRISNGQSLRTGDVVLLGLSGPQLKVVRVGAPPSPTSAPKPPESRPLIAAPVSMATAEAKRSSTSLLIVGGAVAVAILGMAVVLLLRDAGRDTAQEIPTVSIPTTTATPSATGERRVVPKPPPQVATKPPPQLTLDQLVDRNKKAVVWIGLELSGGGESLRYPMYPGWVAAADRVVTTGVNAVSLNNLVDALEGQGKLFVFCDAAPVKHLPVREVRVHPRYKPEAGGDAFTHFNLGVAVVNGSLPNTLPSAGADDLQTTVTVEDGKCAAFGFAIDDELQKKSASGAFIPWVQTNAVLSDPIPGPDDVPFPRRELLGTLAEGAGGVPVFDLRGKVLGTVSRVGERSFLIPSMSLSDLLR